MDERNATALLLRKYRWMVQVMVGFAEETEMPNPELRAQMLRNAHNERILTRFGSALIRTATESSTKRSARRCANPSDKVAAEAGDRVQVKASKVATRAASARAVEVVKVELKAMVANAPGVNQSASSVSAAAKNGRAIIRLENLQKVYTLGLENEVRALDGVSIDIMEGSYVAIMGPSGSGKSTMLNLLGCLDRPTTGNYFLGDVDVARMHDDELSRVRGKRIGFIFQSYNLIAQLTVIENIQVPLIYQGADLQATYARCVELAELVGLGGRLHHRPAQLSGGQQQRVAIARSLVNDPLMILADEPTGNLDSKTGSDVLEMIDKLNAAGKTIVLVTHDEKVAARASRVIHMKDGKVERDVTNPKQERALEAALSI
jgi:putative ABC transport system ATP-binding protein